jgi:tetratricopeptide (TPR) repeat protein
MTGLQNTCLLAVACGLSLHLSQAQAHHGPTKAIETLTDRIAHGERSAQLLARRGDEYRALNDLAAAAADYEAALELDKAWAPALYGMVHLHIERAELEEAREVAERGIALLAERENVAPFYALLAGIHAKRERYEEALQSWDSALASSQPEVDWFLRKAQLLWKLKRHDTAEDVLRSAIRRNPSEALKRAWYEALLRCGRLDEAQQHIDAGLGRARWKSSWLLLRARLHAARGDSTRARQDALAALTEIDQRLQGATPNPFLIADKAQALALLGHRAQAQRHVETAGSLGIPAWKLAGFDFASGGMAQSARRDRP